MSDVSDLGDNRSTTDNAPNPIRVGGNGNQVISENFGVAINSVGRDVVISQPQPKFLSLHQLPAGIADFTGRKAEIDTISQQLLGGKSLVISAVAGMPGVGKSALAIHVAQQLAESDFPDVQLYVDLRGADGDALEPGVVLARWLRAFGLDESMIPTNLQERASVYRSRLAGKRAIILLDNAKDEAQVRPLLPGSQTCVAIVTSRRLLGALEGATVLKLEVMLERDARDLLAKFVGMDRLEAEPQATAEILRLCGGLPLAIRIVAGMLRSKGHWSLTEYGRKLADETQRLEHLQLRDLSVRASFELTYRELSAEDGLLFSRLGILVGKDFGEELAGVVHESDSPVVEGLERLIDAQLLEVDVDKRYYFHDLLCTFSREKLTKSTSFDKQQSVKQQIVEWGHQKSTIMSHLLRPAERDQVVQQWIENEEIPADFDEQNFVLLSLAYFEREREHLLNALTWAEESKQWDIVVSFVSSLLSFFQIRSYWYDWEKACLMAVAASVQAGNKHWESQSLNNLGMVYRSQARWSESIKCFQHSLIIYQKVGDKKGESQSLNNLGTVYASQQKWDESINYLLDSLAIKKKSGDRYAEASTLSNLGNIYNDQNQWDEAIECFKESLIICKESRDRYRESACLNNLGNAYKGQNQWDEAINCYQQSLIISRSLTDWYVEAQALNNLGMVYQCQDLHQDALKCYQSSLTIKKKLGDFYGEAQTLGNLGLLYEKNGETDEAIATWEEALKKFPEGASEYKETQAWIENVKNQKMVRPIQLPILSIIIFAIIAILILATMFWLQSYLT
jgi:tetratricopeptide (TPR) repeat protein